MRTKELREKLGLSVEQLANKINGRTSWIEQQEREALCMWTEQQLRLMAVALDCTVGELFDAPENEQEPEPVVIPEWLTVYHKLADQLKPVPEDDRKGKEALLKSDERIYVVRQDLVGRITIRMQNGREFFFSAHPKGGCVAFQKGEWLTTLNEVTP